MSNRTTTPRRPASAKAGLRMTKARTPDGKTLTLDDCARMLDAQQGFESDLTVSKTSFKVVIRHFGPMPEEPIAFFLSVNSGGYPFLLGGVPTSLDIDIRFNCYIATALEADLRKLKKVDVEESDADGRRAYRVDLLHSLD